MDLALELQHVTKKFGDFVAVEDLSLDVRRGEFFSILGPSGCGKTTTLRLIAGFEHPTAGEIRIGGKPAQNLPPYRRPVNTVFQNYALFPHMTVFENVAYPLRIARVPAQETRRRAMAHLDLVNMAALERRYPQQLSGGQRQRVALARALVARPEVLLLDEPLAALDLHLRQEMQRALKHLQREVGITFVYITHDQGEALSLSDRIAVMSRGKLHQVGSPAEIYSRPSTRFVAGFIGKANLLAGEVVGQDRWTTVRCGDLLIQAGSPAVPVGSRVWLSIRPEKIRYGPAVEQCPNQVPATFVEQVYFGAEREVVLNLQGNQPLMLRTTRFEADPPAEPGAAWRVAWEPQDVTVVPYEGDEHGA